MSDNTLYDRATEAAAASLPALREARAALAKALAANRADLTRLTAEAKALDARLSLATRAAEQVGGTPEQQALRVATTAWKRATETLELARLGRDPELLAEAEQSVAEALAARDAAQKATGFDAVGFPIRPAPASAAPDIKETTGATA